MANSPLMSMVLDKSKDSKERPDRLLIAKKR
jgi:hypothetical protein